MNRLLTPAESLEQEERHYERACARLTEALKLEEAAHRSVLLSSDLDRSPWAVVERSQHVWVCATEARREAAEAVHASAARVVYWRAEHGKQVRG